MSNAAKFRKRAAELESQKDFDKAIVHYARAMEAGDAAGEEVDVAVLIRVGDLTLRLGRVAEAVASYERAVEHYTAVGLFNNAIALCNKILRHAPGRVGVYLTLGRVCARKGMRGDATRNFLEYASRMQKEGRNEEAMTSLSEVASIMPELTEVRRLVEEHAVRVGIELPVAADATSGQEQAKASADSLVFLDVDYDAAVNFTPPIGSVAVPYEPDTNGNRPPATSATPSATTRTNSLDDLLIFDPSSADGEYELAQLDGFEANSPEPLTGQAPVESPSLVDAALDADSSVPIAEAAVPEGLTDALGFDPVEKDQAPAADALHGLVSDAEDVMFHDIGAAIDIPVEEQLSGELVAPEEPVDVGPIDRVGETGFEDDAEDVVWIEVSGVDITSDVSIDDAMSAELEENEQRQMVPLEYLDLDALEAVAEAEAAPSTPDIQHTPIASEIVDEPIAFDSGDVPIHDDTYAAGELTDDESALIEATAEHATAEHATAEHATAEHAPVEHAPVEQATAERTTAEHAQVEPVEATMMPEAWDVVPEPEASLSEQVAERWRTSVPRLDPHDFILPGELPPILIPDALLPTDASRMATPPAALAPIEPAFDETSDVLSAVRPDVTTRVDSARLTMAGLTDGVVDDVVEDLTDIGEEAAADVVEDFTDVGEEAAEDVVEQVEEDVVDDFAHEDAEPLNSALLDLDDDLDDELDAIVDSVTDSAPHATSDFDSGELDALLTPEAPSAIVNVALIRCERLREEADANPGDWARRRRLAEALLEAGELEAGLTELATTALGFEVQGAIDDAARVIGDMVRAAPDNIGFHQRRVELAVRLGDRERLRESYLDLADALVRTGLSARAESVYVRVLELDPWDDRARIALGDAAPPAPARPHAASAADDGYVNLADWLSDDGDALDTRMRLKEPTVTGDENADFDQLLQHFREGVARSLGEDDYESHYDLGVAYKEMGLLDDAIAEFQRALRSPTHRLPAYEALGQCFLEQGSFPVAVTVLSRALHEPGLNDDQRVGVLYLLGYACEALQRRDEARSYFQRVYATDIHFRDVAERLAALDRVA